MIDIIVTRQVMMDNCVQVYSGCCGTKVNSSIRV